MVMARLIRARQSARPALPKAARARLSGIYVIKFVEHVELSIHQCHSTFFGVLRVAESRVVHLEALITITTSP